MSEKKSFLEEINEAKEAKEALETEKVKKAKKADKIESFEEESFVKTKRQFNYGPYILSFLVVLVLAVIYLIWDNQGATMIDTVGLSFEQVEQWNANNDLMILEKRQFSDTVSLDTIISQSVEPGSKLDDDTTVVLQVSDGPDPMASIVLPEFQTDWNRASVMAWLDANHINNYTLNAVASDKVQEDYLMTWRLIGSTAESFNRSSIIEFTFSQVVTTSTFLMPNFLGSDLSAVDAWALDEHVSYDYGYESSDLYPTGQIMAQSHLPDTDVITTDVVLITLSSGSSYEEMQMPSLIGATHQEADSWMKEHQIAFDFSYGFSDVYPQGVVMEQNVATGTFIGKESHIELKVSKGEGMVVPNYASYTYDTADLATSLYGSQVQVTEMYSLTVPEGQLISQSKGAGSRTQGDSLLKVVYSLGNTVAVPDFRGRTRLEVDNWLLERQTAGASIQVTFEENDALDGNNGQVFGQSVYNDDLSLDGLLNFIVATGSRVPDFAVISLDEAQTVALTASYPIEVTQLYDSVAIKGQLISQSISSGVEVHENTYVKVIYSLGDEVIVPDYRNQPIAALKQWIEEQNILGTSIELVEYEGYNQTVTYSNIVAQNVYNQTLPADGILEVLVSKGEAYEVINFTMYDREQIEAIAMNHNLTVIFHEVDETRQSDVVISQEPPVHSIISKNEFIHITIEK